MKTDSCDVISLRSAYLSFTFPLIVISLLHSHITSSLPSSNTITT